MPCLRSINKQIVQYSEKNNPCDITNVSHSVQKFFLTRFQDNFCPFKLRDIKKKFFTNCQIPFYLHGQLILNH